MNKIELSLPLLLPNIPDEKDECVSRLEGIIASKPGIEKAHTIEHEGKFFLCLHYNPEIIPLAQVERLAEVAGAQVTNQFDHGVFSINKIGSEDAYIGIQDELRKVQGILSVSVNTAAQLIRIEWERSQIAKNDIDKLLNEKLLVKSELRGAEKSKPFWIRNQELLLSLFGGLFLLIGFAVERLLDASPLVTTPVYIISYVLGAFDLVRHAIKDLRKGHFSFDIDLLMLLAALGAAVLGEWAEGGLLLFLFSLAHALEHYALDKARSAIKALASLAPPKARVRRNGKDEEVNIEEVRAEDLVIVLPAERISVDGVVNSGVSAVDQAPITGESVPVEKKTGDQVFAGTVNGDGALEIITSKASGDRTLDRIIKLVEEAQTQKAPTEIFTEKFEKIFVPTVLIVDFFLIVIPPLLGLWSLNQSFYRGMALLVAASPCALALGTPSAVLAGIAQAARNGVLIKGGAYLENLGSLRAFAFDKTGTLTIGKPEVTDITPMSGVSEEELLRIGGAVEQRSQHPLAKAVVKKAMEMKLELPEAEDLQSLTARGIRSKVEGRPVELGSLRLWESENIQIPDDIRGTVQNLQEKGRSVIIVKHGDTWLGVLGVRDTPRNGAREVLNQLRAVGIQSLIMLTGDNKGIGEAVGKEVGVDEVKADLLPEDKVNYIGELIKSHSQVAMVGDGVNDAPALAHATVGISMGGAGTAVALETADIALMGDDLSKLPFAVGLSRVARSIIRQNLYISLSVIAFLVVSVVTGFFGMGIAVMVHEGSTMVVIANSLRLLSFRGASICRSDS